MLSLHVLEEAWKNGESVARVLRSASDRWEDVAFSRTPMYGDGRVERSATRNLGIIGITQDWQVFLPDKGMFASSFRAMGGTLRVHDGALLLTPFEPSLAGSVTIRQITTPPVDMWARRALEQRYPAYGDWQIGAGHGQKYQHFVVERATWRQINTVIMRPSLRR